MIPQNEALGESFSKKLILRSKKANKGQKSRKRSERSNFDLYQKQKNFP